MKAIRIVTLLLLGLNLIFMALLFFGNREPSLKFPVIEDNSDVRAVIGNIYITEDDIDYLASSLNIDKSELDKSNREVFLQQIVFDRLLYLEGRSMDLSSDPDMKRMIRDGLYRAYSSMYVKHLEKELYHIDDARIKEFYNENRDMFIMPAKVRLQVIYVQGDENNSLEEKKDAVMNGLSDGLSFEELAEMYSVDPSNRSGGDIGWVTSDTIDPEIADKAFNELKTGEISRFIDLEKGSAIIRLTGRKESRILDLDEAENIIRKEIIKRNKKEYQAQYYNKLEEIRSELIKKYDVKFFN